jgi:hypothetical protein
MLPNTNETLALVKAAQSNPVIGDALAKAGITQAVGLVTFDLQAPSLQLYPVLTPLRNITPRVKGNGGTGANWKAVTVINAAQMNAGVSEGNRGGVVTTTVVNYLATYAGIGLEDFVNFEAEYAAEGFEDVKATTALRLLRAVMIAEEQVILGGNATLALGTTPTPVLVANATLGTIGAGVVVSVIAVALTLDGFQRSTLAVGLPIGPLSKTNADATVDNFGPGVAQKSAAQTTTVSGGTTNSVSATVAIVAGAVAYAWYANTAGVERLFAITTINSCLITSLPGASQLASALPASDQSKNALVFDGFMAQAFKAGSGSYIASLATGVAGTGSFLTSDGAGGIVEITAAFMAFWNTARLSPDTIWCNAQELVNITAKVIKNGGAPLIRFTQSATEGHSAITGGALLDAILNPITQTMVKLRVHPNQAAGTLLFTAAEIPYPASGVGNVFQIKTRQEYRQIDWPLRARRQEYGIYVDEVLQHYAPFSMGILNNIANG